MTDYGFDTKAIHAGAKPDTETGARATPIYQTTAYVFEDVDQAASLFNLQTFGNIYSRLTNPTVAVFEERVATLENGRAAVAVSTGHAAQLVIFHALMEPGDEFLAANKLYGGSITQFGQSFKKMDWHCHFVDPDDPENFRRALTPKCKAIFVESMSNPGNVIVDLAAIAEIAHEAGIPLIVDNTCATPYMCRPFEHGADIIVHSATKYLGGHGNSMGGVIVESGKFDWGANPERYPAIAMPVESYHGLRFFETFGDFAFTAYCRAVGLRDLGPSLSPFNAFMLLTGCETLSLRMDRHCKNAQAVAEFLHSHENVEWVSYAGIPGSKYFNLARKYLEHGSGALFTFGIKGGYDAGVKCVEAVNIFSHLANIGDTRSLILHPASTTHRQLTEKQRISAGAGPEVVRLSIGLETVEDLIADLDQALNQT